MLKRLPVLFLLLAVPWIVSAQVKNVSVTWYVDYEKNTVTLYLANNTTKNITEYNFTYTETYGNQRTEGQHGREMVGVMLTIADPNEENQNKENLRQMYHNNTGTWEAGTVIEDSVGMQPGMTAFDAVVDSVIFADKTAETTNKDALERALVWRRSYAQQLEAENVAIQHALANRGDASPHETAAKEIEAAEKSRNAAYHIQTNGQPSGAVLELQSASQAAAYFHQTVPDYLASLVSKNAKRAALFREHAAPTVENTNAGDAK